ncbi:MAG: glycoside hydrolase family 31 protein [Chloroflexota bacterium]
MAASDEQCWSVDIPLSDEQTTVHILAGDTPAATLRAFSQLTGPAQEPPDWIFGPWMSGNEWNTQAEVMRQVALTEQHDIPATVLVIEAWSDETTFYIWNGAEYDAVPGDRSLRYDDFRFPPTAVA